MSTFWVPSADVICQPTLGFGHVLYERENLLGEYVGPQQALMATQAWERLV